MSSALSKEGFALVSLRRFLIGENNDADETPNVTNWLRPRRPGIRLLFSLLLLFFFRVLLLVLVLLVQLHFARLPLLLSSRVPLPRTRCRFEAGRIYLWPLRIGNATRPLGRDSNRRWQARSALKVACPVQKLSTVAFSTPSDERSWAARAIPHNIPAKIRQ